MQHVMRLAQISLAVAVLLAVAFGASAKAGNKAPVSWSPTSVDVTAERGSSTTVVVSFTTSKKLNGVEIRVSEELSSFITAAPVNIDSVKSKKTNTITLTVSPGDATALGTHSGSVQVFERRSSDDNDDDDDRRGEKGQKRDKSKSVDLALPVVVHIGETVGSSGDTLVSGDGNATLTIPEGALTEDKTITVETSTTTPPADFGEAVSTIYDFGPDGLTFTTPALLTIEYDPATVGDIADLRIAFDDGSGNWQGLPTTLDPSTNTASAHVFHFTRFGIVRPAPSERVAPGPVSNLAAEEDGSAIVLSWTPPAARYVYAEIRRGDNASGPFTLLGYSDPNAVTFRDNAPLSGTSCYEVRAVSRAGFLSTPQSVCAGETPTASVVFDKTDAPNDGGTCGIGSPTFLGPETQSVCGQQFVLDSSATPTSFSVRLYVDGTATDGIVAELRTDSGNTPTGAALATSGAVSAASISPLGGDGEAGIVTFTFTGASSLPAGTYWVVLRATGGPDSGRTYRTQRTLDRIAPLLQASGIYTNGSDAFPSWGTSDRMLRATLEVTTP